MPKEAKNDHDHERVVVQVCPSAANESAVGHQGAHETAAAER
jgi:hypothetical protein